MTGDEYEPDPSDSIADRVNAAASLIAQLEALTDPKAELFRAGLRILDALAISIEPKPQAASLTAINGGKGKNG